MEYIKVFIIIFMWSVLSRKGHLWPSGEEMIVNDGDNVTLDCTFTEPQIYSVTWEKDGQQLAVIQRRKYNYYSIVYLSDTWLDPRHSAVTYGRLFSLKISGAENNDSGEYKCYEDHYERLRHAHGLFEEYRVSAVTCLCSTDEQLGDTMKNESDKVNCPVNCTLHGYDDSPRC